MGLFWKKHVEEKPVEGMQEWKGQLSGGRPDPGNGTKGLYRRRPWIFWGIVVSLLGASALSAFYGLFHSYAVKSGYQVIENATNIDWLYQNTFLLYRDLYNLKTQSVSEYSEIFLEVEEGYEWLADTGLLNQYEDSEEFWNGKDVDLEEDPGQEGNIAGDGPDEPDGEDLSGKEPQEGNQNQGIDPGRDITAKGEIPEKDSPYGKSMPQEAYYSVRDEILNLNGYFQSLENGFSGLNSNYGYVIRDNLTGEYVTNMSEKDIRDSLQDQYFLLSFVFDGAGQVSIGEEIHGNDAEQIRKMAYEVVRDNTLIQHMENNMDQFQRYGTISGPRDCTVTYAVSQQAWEKRMSGHTYPTQRWVTVDYASGLGYLEYMESHAYGDSVYSALIRDELVGILMLCILAAFLLGCFLPVLGSTKPWRNEKICSFSLEVLLGAGMAVFACCFFVIHMATAVISGSMQEAMINYMGAPYEVAALLVMILNLSVLTLYFFCWWYFGVCARAIWGMGIKGYIRQRSLVYRFFPYIKGRCLQAYRAVEHMDLTRNAHRSILKIVILNAAVLFVISLLWFGGLGITVVYSVILYLALRKYVSDIQKKYSLLLKAVDAMAEGNLNVSLHEDLGIFEPFKPQVYKIQNGFKKAVEEEVKSQRMKAELITNVSHDLKTPLTAIITYVNLLKDENITPDQRREYLDTLERKSLRLKVLIEDLFEVSKATSQNMTLNIVDVDIMNLVKQVAFELGDKLEAAALDLRMNLTEEKVILPLDSQKTYRIFENLFGNIAKYAMPGTRVYVNGFRIDDMVVITLKNISAQEITVDSSELTERFVRGDVSRNTEGSGLGLAIAKSFTELQGGKLELEVDGDLFKVTTTWHV